jgi:predicted amidohydrolase YtcJ
MKILFHNGTIIDPIDFNIYEALVVDQGFILAKGSYLTLKADYSQDASLYDLEGQTLMPGFNDSHMHLLGYGQSLFQVDLTSVNSLEALVETSQQFLEETLLPEGEWLLGRGWNQDHFDFPILPSRETLDLISTSHPIFFRRACGHIGVANTFALKAIGLWDMPTQHVDGGYIDLNFDGTPTGILRENAMSLLLDRIDTPGAQVLSSYIERAQTALFSGGITSVQSDDLCVFPMKDTALILETFQAMGLDGRLKISVHEQSLMRTSSHFETWIKNGYTYQKSFGAFSYGPLKILGDGSLGARTAFLRAPYADQSDTSGIPMYTQDELNALVKMAYEHHIPVAIHGIGDGMIEQALKAIEVGQKLLNSPNLRSAIVHCQITDLPLLKKMSDLGVIGMVQPIFLDYDLHIVEERVGKERASSSYAFKTMETLGIKTAYGTDCPVEGYHVFKGVQCAVTRQDLNHFPIGGWLPEEAVTIEEALRAYTVGSAYASGEEMTKGSLGVGMVADLVILDQNPLTMAAHELSTIQIRTTFKSGEIVYTCK